MFSSVQKKAWRDLSRNKSRTFFTIVTITLGVMGIALFAVNPLAQEAADKEIKDSNMFDIRIALSDVELTSTQLQGLQDIINVNKVEPRVQFYTRMYIGDRRNPALFVGIPNFEDQKVDIIESSGDSPIGIKVLTEKGNDLRGIYDGKEGDNFKAIDINGKEQKFRIAGSGKSLVYISDTVATFYADALTVRGLGGFSGYNILSFDLEKTDEESVRKTIEDIRDYLVENTSVVAFANLPVIREEGEWAGKEMLDIVMSMMYSLTILALFCSVFLISNTMNTLIAEQRREIAQMKAIGATRFQIFRFYLSVSLIIGTIGSTIGALLGIFITYLILLTIGRQIGLDPKISVHLPTIILSILVGVLVVILASLPALRRSVKTTVAEGLRTHGISAKFGKGLADRLLIVTLLFPRTIQMGVRNAFRNKIRSISTIFQVTLTVGIFIALVSVSHSLEIAVSGAYGDWSADIQVFAMEEGSKTLTEESSSIIKDIKQIESVEPYIGTQVSINDRNRETFGFVSGSEAYDYKRNLSKGRWLSEEDSTLRSKVAVIGEAVAKLEDIDVGDTVSMMTATGAFDFEIIGMDKGLFENGQVVFMPYETLKSILQKGDVVSGFFIQTKSKDHDVIDKTSTMIEDKMVESGYVLNNEIRYVLEERNQEQNAGIANMMIATSTIIVMISLVGLMGSLTMNILERTREIGMLRCIGSSARKIRNIFSSEGVLLSLMGWTIGIPAGYILGYVLWRVLGEALKIDVPFYFDSGSVILSLIVTIAGSILIIQLPIRRATRIKPGDALRYE